MGHDTPIPADGSRSGDSSDVRDSGDGVPDDLDRLADVEGRLDRLADLDDRLGGHAADDDDAAEGEPPAGDSPPEGLDAILLLRQLAAEERGGEGENEPESPRRIGRFAIVREVGRGGFARVYEAFDTRLLRRVALKVARPEAVLPAGARKRFVREAELAARLVHPHVVTIHEAGEADGHLFIAEEFCPGGSLGEWLERHPGPLPPRVAARLVHTLAGAVAHSHGFCILHRDVKPANVLLVPAEAGPLEADGATGRLDVKLADFGLGKLADPASAPGTAGELTRVGARVGTPAWMAPEQVDQALGPVGPAADVHALGLLLDRLLTGRCAHAGSDDAETMRLVLTAEPVPPDRIVPGVPADLAAVTAKCLAKHPADRYATVADLAADLGRFLDGRPTVARPVSALERTLRVVRRHRALVAASALSLVAVSVALLALGLERHKQRLLAERAAEVRGLQAAATLRRGFESWRTGDVPGALSQLEACRALDPQLAASLAGGWLRTRLHGEEAILLGPDEGRAGSALDLHAVDVAPDGAVVAAGGADGRLALVRLDDGADRLPPRVALHDEINDVAFSPDGTRVATAGQDGRVCVCDAADGRLVGAWSCDEGPLFGVAWSPDGASLACGGASRAIRIVFPSSPERAPTSIQPFDTLAPPVDDGTEIEALAWVGPDRLAAACGNRVVIAEIATGGVVHDLGGHAGTVFHLALSPDGRLLVTGGSDRQPRIWLAGSGRLVAELPPLPSWVGGCRFTADGRYVVTGCRDGIVRVHPLAGGPATPMVGHVGRVWDVAALPGGGIVSVGSDGTLRRFDAGRGPEFAGLRRQAIGGGPIGPVALLDASPSADRLVVGEGRVTFLNAEANVKGVADVSARFGLAIDVPRGRFAAVDDGFGVVVAPIPGERGRVTRLPGALRGRALAWCGDAGLLVGTGDGRVVLWDVSAGRVVPVDDLRHSVDAIDVSFAGAPMAAVVAGKTLCLYELSATGMPRAGRGRTLLELPPTVGTVRVVSFAPDGASLVVGTNEGGVERYDVRTGLALGSFARHSSDIRALEWSPDGRTLVSADSACVRFSDVRTTTVFDDFRPGWTIESARLSFRAGAAPTLVVAGNADAPDDGTPGGRIAVATFPGE